MHRGAKYVKNTYKCYTSRYMYPAIIRVCVCVCVYKSIVVTEESSHSCDNIFYTKRILLLNCLSQFEDKDCDIMHYITVTMD